MPKSIENPKSKTWLRIKPRVALTPWNAISGQYDNILSNNRNFSYFGPMWQKIDELRKNRLLNSDSTTVVPSVQKFVASTQKVWKRVHSTKFALFSGFKLCRIVRSLSLLFTIKCSYQLFSDLFYQRVVCLRSLWIEFLLCGIFIDYYKTSFSQNWAPINSWPP